MFELKKRPGLKFIPNPEGSEKVNGLCIFKERMYAATDIGVFVYDEPTKLFERIRFIEEEGES